MSAVVSGSLIFVCESFLPHPKLSNSLTQLANSFNWSPPPNTTNPTGPNGNLNKHFRKLITYKASARSIWDSTTDSKTYICFYISKGINVISLQTTSYRKSGYSYCSYCTQTHSFVKCPFAGNLGPQILCSQEV